MITIQLEQLRFFAKHGLFKEEHLTGNEFEVDVSIDFNAPEKIESISDTLDYAAVYSIIRKRMLTQTSLLETLTQELVELIHTMDSRVQKVTIKIVKLQAPIAHFSGKVGIIYSKEFNG